MQTAYTTILVNGIDYTVGSSVTPMFSFDYTYDRVGNIKSAYFASTTNNVGAGGTNNYFYDSQNQLVMEINRYANKTYLYEYDTYGNIRKKYTFNGTSYTTVSQAQAALSSASVNTYTYGNSQWKDQLTSFNGNAFTYDAIGNPTKYNNGKSYNFQWQKGRELYRSSVGGVVTYYAYGADGLRTIKNTTSTGGDKFNYYYANGKLISQIWEDGAKSISFLYDEAGSVYGFVYRTGTTTLPYYYIKNLQGDVIAIVNQYNQLAGSYTYDAWGNVLAVRNGSGQEIDPTASHIANLNPIRYRSYYYDTETGFYYLQSRYYDPATGRFINADGHMSTGQGFAGYNMYAYCGNNPVMLTDENGEASYKNSITKNKNGSYTVTTTISFWFTKRNFKYEISKNGVVKFDFSKNDYWSLLWRAETKTLANAMYDAAKDINKNNLKGRSISGISAELTLHYAAYKVGLKPDSSKVADMGSMVESGNGYDGNAWFFESITAKKMLSKLAGVITKPWKYVSIIKGVLRYL